ncbi:BA75_01073T0 [Komagataella pastoris]|uniref:BA75_01073T0 n=1 Tax=Komagataella pastoris TaxID=4922 RepID=A0A1B2J7N5_PICPA|nr:BA75_01073T0 [Komagataella pastoris]
MVSFSCEVCNDTVTKKKLEQHTVVCCGAYFTCIDCSTTFEGSSFRSHTSCISESEKYEKGLFRGKKHRPHHQILQDSGKSVIPNTQARKQKSSENNDKVQSSASSTISSNTANPRDHQKESLDINIGNYVTKRQPLNKFLKKIAKETKQDKKKILHNIYIWKDSNGRVIIG